MSKPKRAKYEVRHQIETMAYKKNRIGALVDAAPATAREEILKAYEEAKCSQRDAAKALDCAENTLIRWIDALAMRPAIEKLKKRAAKEGWHHDHKGGRPALAKKKARRARPSVGAT
jgi:hypothetical protein